MSNPLNWTGPEFLSLYVGLLIPSVAAGALLRWWLRQPADAPPRADLQLDPYRTAFLAGGDRSLCDAALTSLVHSGVLEVRGDQKLAVHGAIREQAHPVEKAACSAAGSGNTVSAIRTAVSSAADPLRRTLEKRGLLVADGQVLTIRFVSALPLVVLMLLGLAKLSVGLSRDKPVAFLSGLLVVSVFALFMLMRRPHLSRRGDLALAQLRQENSALELTNKRNSAGLGQADLILAVGLFGTGLLATGPLANLHTALQPPSSGGSGCGSSCSGGGCGGGCGGGGCGGCS